MKHNKKWNRACSLVLAAVVLGNCGSFPGSSLLSAYAAETKTPLDSYTEAQMLIFGDNVLEY
ncbi:MAG: hypothetical protein II213_03765, partial [Lachnospiraceae bacterium]|nr:hypothetical protein [Lachnospiraceae bacterium]